MIVDDYVCVLMVVLMVADDVEDCVTDDFNEDDEDDDNDVFHNDVVDNDDYGCFQTPALQ